MLDAVPIALMEFRLSGERLVLLTANAAARRMPGLGGVREPGADARAVFDQLAGTALIFDITVKSVRAASAEEIGHGHVHGEGGHHH